MKKRNPAKRHLRQEKASKPGSREALGRLPTLKQASDFTTKIRLEGGVKATATLVDNNVRVYEPGKRSRRASPEEEKKYFRALKKKSLD